MPAIQRHLTLGGYQLAVQRLTDDGTPFSSIEDAINDIAHLNEDQKAALWLLAFALRDPTEQEFEARAHLAAVR